jgi:dethiobiotin synthetase
MSARGVFVAGTDTGVGKTVVAAALLCLWRERGIDAVPVKPVQTGCTVRGGRLVAPDLEFCRRMAELTVTDPIEERWMSPYRFRPACSPHLAARLARTRIALPHVRRCVTRLCRRHEAVVVEGAGGVLVPIEGRRTVADLMACLGLPAVLVARAGLGTLNHTLLSLEALRARGVAIAGVVLNAPDRTGWGAIEADNRRTIGRLGGVPVLGVVPHVGTGNWRHTSPSDFRRFVARHLGRTCGYRRLTGRGGWATLRDVANRERGNR